MEGGHGNVAAYGKTLETLGVDSAVTAALAAATLGLVAGGLIGGPVVRFLIKKFDLKPEQAEASALDYSDVDYNKELHSRMNPTTVFIVQFTIITVSMAIGTYLAIHLQTNGY